MQPCCPGSPAPSALSSLVAASPWNVCRAPEDVNGSRLVSPNHAARELCDTHKKRSVFPSFMVGFTVKVLICIDTFLKCCAKLKLNTWVRPGGFKEPVDAHRSAAHTNEICMHILSTWSPQCYLLMHSGEATGMERKFIPGFCWWTAERMCICICTNIAKEFELQPV